MRICLITRNFPGTGTPLGGGEISSRYLARFLAESKHNVYVLTRHRDGGAEITEREGFTVIYSLSDPKIPPRPGIRTALNWAANIPQLTAMIEHIDPEIIHSYSIDMQSRIQIALGERSIPSVATINNHFVTCPFLHLDPDDEICIDCNMKGMLECFRSKRIPPLAPFEKLLQLIRSAFARGYDHYTVLSESHKRILIRNGFPSSKITVIPNFIDPPSFRARAEKYRDEIERELGIRRRDKVVSFVGHLRRQKGAEYLIRSIPAILQALPETKFLVVGSGPERDRLLRLAGSLRVADSVRFVPYIENERIPGLYKLSRAFIFPSIWPEPFGRVLIEAMTVGTPVIASRVGGVPEIIKDERGGILIPPRSPESIAEAAISLLKDENRCKRIGEGGKRRVEEEYTLGTVGPKILDVYKSILRDD